MKTVSCYDLIDLSIEITWEKNTIKHREFYFADQMNCWRDIFPGSVLEAILENDNSKTITLKKNPGELIPDYRADRVITLSRSRFNFISPVKDLTLGRFYPQGMISGLTGVFKDNIKPFRCVGIDQNLITVDLNHPMAGIPMEIAMTVHTRSPAAVEQGGSSSDWIDLALSGPGMQAQHKLVPTVLFPQRTFDRKDPGPDTLFYEKDRFVHHIDDKARENLSNFYGTLIQPKDNILDLMAGWESHIPDNLTPVTIHGLGLNANELRSNPRLTSHTVQDLNTDPTLYFKDHTFDGVICSLSVEYLTDPVTLFNGVARVLKPGGIFALTFSNRWFPEKAISIWEKLHDFERMGLVTQYFFKSGLYESISTFSLRGYPRPEQDDYWPKLRLSDPLYAVIGRSRK